MTNEEIEKRFASLEARVSELEEQDGTNAADLVPAKFKPQPLMDGEDLARDVAPTVKRLLDSTG